MGTADFTIDFWFKSSTGHTIMGNNTSAWGTGSISITLGHDTLGANNLFFFVSGANSTNVLLKSTSEVKDNQWHHAAISRSSNVFRLFIDGKVEATNTSTVAIDFSYGGLTHIGGCGWDSVSSKFHGYLDNFRVTKGLARWTSDFTPPKATPIANLIATADSKKINLSWSPISNATGYNIYRSTTESGPYNLIKSSVTESSYADTQVSNKTTYYYVVTSICEGSESIYSNEVCASLIDGNALVRITMDTGECKEYDMTQDEASAFVSWYNGDVSLYYAIDKGFNLSCFASRKDYVAHKRIAYFEVMSYTDTTSSSSPSTSATNSALLRISMENGDVLEYEMTSDNVDAFVTWYTGGATSSPTYSIAKTYNLGPFTDRTDYVVYDQIANFEVLKN
jgi:Fibronectin type 3 domain-containing protein